MNIKTLIVGDFATNCYVCWGANKIAAVIDPADDAVDILDFINSKGLTLKYIINTHGHADHMGANNELKDKTGAQILIHEKDKDFLLDANKNLSAFREERVFSYKADVLLQDGVEIVLGDDISFTVIETPGHTMGSISLLCNDECIFTGDTLFFQSIGRTDFPGSSPESMMQSLKKFKAMNTHLKIYPGHGHSSTLGYELNNNPFLNGTT
ncbi:MBL fold metallo-hydrolase [bacterium]